MGEKNPVLVLPSGLVPGNVTVAAEPEKRSGEPVEIDTLVMKEIEYALEYFRGNKSKAAKALGITLKTLYNKLDKFQMSERYAVHGKNK